MRKLTFILFLLIAPTLMASAQRIDTAGLVFKSDTRSSEPKAANDHGLKIHSGKSERSAGQSLWAIFIGGFVGGALAFFMPCIFPMLPMTIAFFTKKSGNRKGAIGKALVYGASIIVIYVILGLLVTLTFGPDALNALSTNGVFNFLFFLMLVIFAASFLGAFELILPSGWVNATDARSEQAGFAGLFFMAATLALVSFSCTGPIIGTLLVQAATQGALLGPVVGMFGYALALALPFAFFALFPSWIQALPKSGGWLNSVKVCLGFLELALSLKFLSNVDLAYHWHWFDREVFLVLWIIIFALCGFYLLGKLKLTHDSAVTFITVPRLFSAIVVLAFTIYLVPGLWGAPLKSVSAFLPPMSTQDFDLSTVTSTLVLPGSADTAKRKYGGLFDKPKGFNPYFDYDEGLAYAKKIHKPVMIDFTGHACVNCRKMEANVWTDPQVLKCITEDYVLIQLYVDDKTDLPAVEQLVTPEGRTIKTIGNKWSYLQTSKFVSNSQPFYVLFDPNTLLPLIPPQGAEYQAASFLRFLKTGLKTFP